MEATGSSWAFIVSLVAVVNGLGIVRLLGAIAEFLRRRGSVQVNHYWVYYVLAVFQLLVHVLFWWSILGLRDAGGMNFLRYLYVLIGPTLLFLATSVLVPDSAEAGLDLRQVYLGLRPGYYTIMALFWTWATFIWPVFVGRFAPNVPGILAYLVLALVLRSTSNLRVHALLVIVNCILYGAFIVGFALEFGGVGRIMTRQ
jgi:hypothetical protein